MRSLPRNALLFGLGLVVGCFDLEPIDPDVCGNGVVEDNESCDPGDRERTAPDPYPCRKRGTVGECRVDCSVVPEDGSNPCPAGWGCGADAICREPTGEFVALGVPVDAEVRQIQTADFDGDGRLDVLTANDHELKAHYFSQTGALETTFALSINRAYPSVGDLTGDTLADIAVKTRLGVGVLRGRSDRTFSPTVYASQDIPGTSSARILAIDALPVRNGPDGLPTKYLGDEPMAITEQGMGATLFYIDLEAPDPDPVVLFVLPGQDVEGLGDEIPIGHIDEDPLESPCEEMVLAFQGRAEVFVVTPCTRLLGGQIELNELGLPPIDRRLPTMVNLADGRKIDGGAKLFDVNQDGHLDLVIGVTSPEGPVVQFAFGVGDGTFHSTPDLTSLPPTGGDNNAGWFQGFDTKVPLAIGHLNPDGVLDFVRPDGIFVSLLQAVPDGQGGFGGGATFDYSLGYAITATPSGEPWTSARIADFNGNYLPDVIAAADTETGLDFFNGVATGLFNRFTIATLGNVKHMAVGDFDGDVLLDVALAEGRGSEDDALSVLFGQLAGPLEPPLVMGRLESILQIVESNLADRTVEGKQTLDAISEVSVLSLDGAALKLALISGSTDRLLQSPFALTDGFMPGSMQNEPVKVVIGQFTDDDHPDIAALAPGEGLGYHLWLAQSTDEAVLKGTTTSSARLDSLSKFPEAIVVPVDLDKHDPEKRSLEEVAVFLPDIMGTSAELAVARDSGASSWSITFSDPLEGMSFVNSADQRLTPGLASTAVADIDGDGLRDVVVMGFVDAPDGGKLPRAIIFWNTPDAAGNGGLDATNRTQVPVIMTGMNEIPLNAFAVIDADADLPREIVLVTAGNTYLVEIDGATRTVGEPRELDVDGGGDTIAVADMNRDGVEDLILGNASGFLIFQQKPRIQ